MTVGQTFGEQIALMVSDSLHLGLFMMHARLDQLQTRVGLQLHLCGPAHRRPGH